MPIIAAMLVDPAGSCDEVERCLASSDPSDSHHFTPDSRLAWVRLALALAIGSISGVGMWSVVVALPAVQAEFGVRVATLRCPIRHHAGLRPRRRRHRAGWPTASASSRRWRSGIVVARRRLCAAGLSATLWQLSPCIVLIGLGTSASFAPLMAEVSHWFERRRGLAVDHRRQRQLCRRRDLAADDQLWHPVASAGATPISALGIFSSLAMTLLLAGAARPDRRRHARPRQRAAAADRSGALDQYADGAAVHRRHRLLRGDGDAAGAYRRLLRRSRLRPGARRRDAVVDAGVRHRQPDRLGLSRRPDRRHPHAADRLGGAGVCAAVLSVLRQPVARST